MIPVLTAEEMREADRRTIEHEGVAGATLMEAAGGAVADAVRRQLPEDRLQAGLEPLQLRPA